MSAPSHPGDRGPDPDDLAGHLVDPGLMPAGADAHVAVDDVDDAATETLHPGSPADRPGWHVRLFGSREFFRLWLAQVVASLGDWVGFFAIALLAGQLAQGSQAGAIGLVMTARILPGFFLAPLGGVLVDRFDRRRVMVVCNLGRAGVVALLPFAPNIALLVVGSFALEAFALLWSPAKEATVPNLVPHDHLTTANSLGMAAAYGTFPLASVSFTLLATLSTWLGGVDAIDAVPTDRVAIAFWFQAVMFLASAAMIRTIAIPARHRRSERQGAVRIDWLGAVHDLRDGWRYMFINHTVRAVNLGVATGLIGGGMLIPLGAAFATEVLDAGDTGYGLFVTALGFGVAAGVVLISVLQRRLPADRVFTAALLAAGSALILAASMSSLGPALVFVFVMGMSAGPIYVLGYAMLQTEVADDLRGRVIAAFNTLVRLCVLISMTVGPLLAGLLGSIADAWFGGRLEAAGVSVAVPGVRLTLWLAGLIIIGAGMVATRTLRAGQRAQARAERTHPANGSDTSRA